MLFLPGGKHSRLCSDVLFMLYTAMLKALVYGGALLYVFSKSAKFSMHKPSEEMVGCRRASLHHTRSCAAPTSLSAAPRHCRQAVSDEHIDQSCYLLRHPCLSVSRNGLCPLFIGAAVSSRRISLPHSPHALPVA